jgi:hypothetical protein
MSSSSSSAPDESGLYLTAAGLKTLLSYAVTVFVGCFVLYRVLRPFLKARAKRIMMGMLADAGIVVGKDVVIKDDEIFLEWMRNGLLGIGESFMAGQWESKISLDDFLFK